MKDKFDLPKSARTAFESYPTLQPSASFNRAVLEQLEKENKRRKTTFIGQIEEFLGLDLWRFAASGMLGAFVPALILGALYFSNRGTQPPISGPDAPDFPSPAFQEANPFYARELEELPKFQRPANAEPARHRVTPSPQGGEVSCVHSQSHLV